MVNLGMTLSDASVNRVLFHLRAEPVGYGPLGRPTGTRSGEAVLCGYLHDHPAADTLLLFFHGNGEIAADYDALPPRDRSALNTRNPPRRS